MLVFFLAQKNGTPDHSISYYEVADTASNLDAIREIDAHCASRGFTALGFYGWHLTDPYSTLLRQLYKVQGRAVTDRLLQHFIQGFADSNNLGQLFATAVAELDLDVNTIASQLTNPSDQLAALAYVWGRECGQEFKQDRERQQRTD